jgi:hypothetical protein
MVRQNTLASLHVLIVEEDTFQAGILSGILAALGILHVTVLHGCPDEDTVERFAQRSWDAIVLGMNGEAASHADAANLVMRLSPARVVALGGGNGGIDEHFRARTAALGYRVILENARTLTFCDLVRYLSDA